MPAVTSAAAAAAVSAAAAAASVSVVMLEISNHAAMTILTADLMN